jgi:hypothetical protein
MRVLVMGWFSTDDGEITAGDMLACATVRGWLAAAGVPHDVAAIPGFRSDGDVGAEHADPARYSHVLFVCGPVASPKITRLLERFGHCRRIAVGVSMTPGAGGSFDDVLPRDDGAVARPDLSLDAPPAATAVVGVTFGHPQPEYGDRGRHDLAHGLVRDLMRQTRAAPLELDTRLDARDALSCGTAERFTSLIARVDAVVTTRLHGLVLALRAGVPALALDPIAGGAKVAAQAAALAWPAARTVDETDVTGLAGLLDWCLTAEARTRATDCAQAGRGHLRQTHAELLKLLGAPRVDPVADGAASEPGAP